MKRVLLCVAAAALIVPAGGVAAKAVSQTVYLGDFDGVPDSQVKLKTAAEGGDAEVHSFFAREVPVACEGGAMAVMERVGLRGVVRINGHRVFRVKDDNGKTTMSIKGRAGRNKATGTFRFFGEMDAGDAVLECDTHRLIWIAR